MEGNNIGLHNTSQVLVNVLFRRINIFYCSGHVQKLIKISLF